ncbi:hypothetical protein [Paraferrimonas haliotis]|uniref:Outer membrane protein beta-barrel domain-containing protein n=1 Tax=Paraferrimonas haliotis TaxID=2013866 RepID=A0AA37TKD6_9GAMM|nr:hypothetical protein [Paraferrimonas haliotis]GLS83062.1 hypothetical protein GCM10007894_10390 [Paraferrimonas haliotis]
MKKLMALALLASLGAMNAQAQNSGDQNFKAAELLVGKSFGNANVYYETDSDIGYHEIGAGYSFEDVLIPGLSITPHAAFIGAVNGGDDKGRAQLGAKYSFLDNAFVRAEYRYTSGSKEQELAEPYSASTKKMNHKFDEVQRARIGAGYDFGMISVSYDVFAHQQDNDVIAARENRRHWNSAEFQVNLNTGTGLTPFVRMMHTTDAGLVAGNKPEDKALFGLSYWIK